MTKELYVALKTYGELCIVQNNGEIEFKPSDTKHAKLPQNEFIKYWTNYAKKYDRCRYPVHRNGIDHVMIEHSKEMCIDFPFNI